MDNFTNILFRLSIQLPGFLLAIVFHEAAHAFIANRCGDNTAKVSGRLNLNPLSHIDPIGTVIFPLIGAFTGGIMFGWAKPVPIDTRNFKNLKKSVFWVSFAGPAANILLAFVMAFLSVVLKLLDPSSFFLLPPLIEMVDAAIVINMVLAFFNLIPFPPLDGSKMAASFMDYNMVRKYEGLTQYTLFFFLILMFTGALKYILFPAFLLGNSFVSFFSWLLG